MPILIKLIDEYLQTTQIPAIYHQLSCLGDSSQLKTYKLPEAQRFARTFCTECGGPLPREIGDTDLSYDMARAIGTAFGENPVEFGERGAVVEMIFYDQ